MGTDDSGVTVAPVQPIRRRKEMWNRRPWLPTDDFRSRSPSGFGAHVDPLPVVPESRQSARVVDRWHASHQQIASARRAKNWAPDQPSWEANQAAPRHQSPTWFLSLADLHAATVQGLISTHAETQRTRHLPRLRRSPVAGESGWAGQFREQHMVRRPRSLGGRDIEAAASNGLLTTSSR